MAAAGTAERVPVAWRAEGTARPGAGLPRQDPGAAAGDAAALAHRDDVVVLLLARMRLQSLAWGWSRVVLGGWPLRQLPGLRWAKALGSGHDGGFGLRPSLLHQGLFLVFDGMTAADRFRDASATLQTYREHAAELLCATLRATSSRGSWGGRMLGVSAETPAEGPVAALTRASIRPLQATRFWRLAPAAQAALQQAQGCRLAAGLGEAPLLRQATFSLWDNALAMNDYARGGAHGLASRAALSQGFFSESMFVRFQLLRITGSWQGRCHG